MEWVWDPADMVPGDLEDQDLGDTVQEDTVQGDRMALRIFSCLRWRKRQRKCCVLDI